MGFDEGIGNHIGCSVWCGAPPLRHAPPLLIIAYDFQHATWATGVFREG